MTYDGVKTKLGPTLRRIENVKKILGGTPLYKLYRYVPPHWVGFFRRFGLKTGINFAHLLGLESGMVFEETTGLYDWKHIHRFNSK